MRKLSLLLLMALMLPLYAMADYNHAITFSSAVHKTEGDRVDVPYSALNPTSDPYTGDWTAGVWYRQTSLSSTGGVVFNYTTLSHDNINGALVVFSNTEGIKFTGWGFNNNITTVSNTSSAVSLNEWHYLVVTVSNTNKTMEAYVDGTKVYDGTIKTDNYPLFTSSPDEKDGAFTLGGYNFLGAIDEFALYNHAFSAADVAAAMKDAKAVSGLTALYDFQEVVSGTLNEFANKADSNMSGVNAKYVKTKNGASWATEPAGVTEEDAEPDLTTITEETARVVESGDVKDEWKSIGIGRFNDGFISQPYGTSAPGDYTQRIEFQESTTTPGLYRVVNPYKNHGYLIDNGYGYEAQYDDTEDHYMIVDATNPESVTIPWFFTGVYLGGDKTQPIYAASCSSNKFVDGILRYEQWGLMYKITESGNQLSANWLATFRLVLPSVPDYETSISAVDACLGAANTAAIAVNPGRDVKKIKWGICNFMPTTDGDKAAAIANGTEVTLPLEGNLNVPVTKNGLNTIVVGVYNDKGEIDNYVTEAVLREEWKDDEWESLGTTAYVEGFVQSWFGNSYGPYTDEVEIQEHKTNKGLYRMANPMSYWANANDHQAEHNHYFVINATNPEKVYFEESSLGIDLGYGVLVATSPVHRQLMKGVSIDEIEAESFGKLENGKISIPASAVWVGMTRYDYSQNYNATLRTNFELVIPAKHTVTVKSNTDTKYGTVAIEGEENTTITTEASAITVVATPAENISFKNWTNEAGEELSRNTTYTHLGSIDEVLTANFFVNFHINQPENGSIIAKAGETELKEDNDLAPGTEVIVTVNAPEGMETSALLVNTDSIKGSGPFTLTLEKNDTISAVFAPISYTVYYTTYGNGEVQLWSDLGEDESPVGPQLENFASVPYNSPVALYLFPGKTAANEYETVQSVIVRTGEESTTLKMDVDMWESEWNADKHVVVGSFDVKGNTTVSVVFTTEGETSAIEGIGTDNANTPAEYFNLQGVKVASDNLTPGIYIVRRGATTAKEYVK